MTDLSSMNLDQDAIQNANDNIVEATDANAPSPGFFSGVSHGVQSIAPGVREAFGGSVETPQQLSKDVSLLNSLSPQPNASMFNQFGYSIGSTIPLAIGGAFAGSPGGPVGAMTGTMALPGLVAKAEEKNRLMAEGVDPVTAEAAGQTAGLGTSLSMMVPASPLGEVPLALKMVGGAVVQRFLGKGQTVVASKILDDGGYHEMADQYRESDKNAAAGEYITGALFGGLSHLHGVLIKPSDADHAAMAVNLHQEEVESAPGIPTTPATRDAHIEAMRTATRQLLNGEPVDVSKAFENGEANFAIKPNDITDHKAYADALRTAGFTEQADAYEKRITDAETVIGNQQEKLSQVVEKHDQTAQQVTDLQRQHAAISDEINRPLPISEKVGMVDPVTGDRLKSIEDELGTQINSSRRDALEKEYQMLTEGQKFSGIQDKIQERQNALIESRVQTAKAIEGKQKDVARYAAEAKKRSEKLNGKTETAARPPLAGPETENPKPVIPGKNVAEEVLKNSPDMQIVNDEGTGLISAKDAIQDAANTEPLEARKNMIQAAINCFLRG